MATPLSPNQWARKLMERLAELDPLDRCRNMELKPEPRRKFKAIGTEQYCFEHGVFLIEVYLARYYNADPDGRKTMADNYAGGRLAVRAYTVGHVYLAQIEIPLTHETPATEADNQLDYLLPKLIDKAHDRLWEKLAGEPEPPLFGNVIVRK